MSPLPLAVSQELFYLLVRVAYADLELSTSEKVAIFDLARRLELDVSETRAIGNALEGRGGVPLPNLTVLKDHKGLVMEAVERIITADGNITDTEVAIAQAVMKNLLRL